MAKAVLDTNVIISALLFSGNLSVLVDHWKRGSFQPVLSQPILEEYIKVLGYSKFKLLDQEIKSILYDHLLPYVEIVSIQHQIRAVKADPSDDKFLECAVGGKTDYLVTGDKALLKLKNYQGIKIITPAIFLLSL